MQNTFLKIGEEKEEEEKKEESKMKKLFIVNEQTDRLPVSRLCDISHETNMGCAL